MTFNIEKMAQTAKPRSQEALERARFRKENREWLRMSQEFALCLHYYLRTMGMTQKELADKMGVSAVYIGKLLKGGENMTLETICKIQKAIGEILVTVAKPYVCNTVIKIASWTRFSPDAVTSDSYTDNQSSQDYYSPMINDVA